MSDDVIFTSEALAQYIEWQTEDRKTIARINTLIKDIQRNGFMVGIGKPEALKYRNTYSRRIDEQNRLVYEDAGNETLRIISCKGHYED